MLSKEYIAGFFDGEGHLGITISGKNKQCTLRLTLVNTNLEILQMIKMQYGGNISLTSTSRSWSPSYRPTWKKSYQLKLNFSEIKVLLADISEFIIVKSPQVKLAFEFIEFTKSPGRLHNKLRTDDTIKKELHFKNNMHLLNKTGT